MKKILLTFFLTITVIFPQSTLAAASCGAAYCQSNQICNNNPSSPACLSKTDKDCTKNSDCGMTGGSGVCTIPVGESKNKCFIKLSTNLPIGSLCNINSECHSGDCEGSQKKDAAGNSLSYCDCDDDNDCNDMWGTPATGSWECVDGAALTFDLDYCVNKEAGMVKATLPEYNNTSIVGKLLDSVLDTKVAQANLLKEVTTFKPVLEIRLPGLEFSDLANTVDSEGYLQIPWIGEFLKTAYNFGLVIISIVAVVMIIIQGAKIIVSGGESKVEAYKKIGQIAVGLVIAWGSYAILYTINPALVEFKSLKVKYIEPVLLPDYPEGLTDEDVAAANGGTGNAGSYTGVFDPAGTEKYASVPAYAKCLMGKYNLKVNVKPETQTITLFGAKNVEVNKYSVDAWKKAEKEITESSDQEIKEYLGYMKDVAAGTAPNLSTQESVKDSASTLLNTCGFGYARKKINPCVQNTSLTRDMHQGGMAVDFNYASNGDFTWGTSSNENSGVANKQCAKYKEVYELQKTKFSKYPLLSKRIEVMIVSCFNKFDNGTNPFTTHPKKFIEIFKNNGFVWGGDFCNKVSMRTDSMHFEYWGECKQLRCNGRP